MNRSRNTRSLLTLLLKVLDDPKQSLRFHGLAHNGDRPGVLSSLRNVVTSRNYHDGNIGQLRILASLGEESPAIEHRHLHVQKNQPRMCLRGGEQPKCFPSVSRALNDVTVEREEFSKVFA